MIRIIRDSFGCNYKLSLNKKSRTLRIWIKYLNENRYQRHLISSTLTLKDVRDIEDNADSDLLYWLRHDYGSDFSIWR